MEEKGVDLNRMSVSNSLKARVLALISMRSGGFAWGERAIFRKNIQIAQGRIWILVVFISTCLVTVTLKCDLFSEMAKFSRKF